jgi:hypothetical protein
LVVNYTGKNGKTINIGLVRGVSVYTTVNKRHVAVRLNKVDGVDLSLGKLKLLYTSPKDAPYVVYAEKEMLLSK